MSPASGDGLRHLSVVNQEFASTAFDRLVRKLRAAGYLDANEVVANDFKCLCPIHENTGTHDPSLRVTKKDDGSGGVWVNCNGNTCSRDDVYRLIMAEDAELPPCRATQKSSGQGAGGFLISELELHPDRKDGDELYLRWCAQEAAAGIGAVHEAAHYIYRSEDGREIAAKVRWSNKNFTWLHRSGNFWQRGLKRLDESVPLYRIDEVVASEGVIYCVEGEKDVDRLWEDGLIATSLKPPTKKLTQVTESLAGRVFVVIPDNDSGGRVIANQFARAAAKAGAKEVRVLPPFGEEDSGYDVSDWFADGGTVAELEMMASTDEMVEIIRPDQLADSSDGASTVDSPEDELAVQDYGVPGLTTEMLKDKDWSPDYTAAVVRALKYDSARDDARELKLRLLGAEGGDGAGDSEIDMDQLLAGDDAEKLPPPTMFRFEDTGCSLFYDGVINTVFGYGGHGKSMIMAVAVAQALIDGRCAAYFTYELPPKALVARLMGMGVTKDMMRDRLSIYQSHIGSPGKLLERRGTDGKDVLVVVDSTNKALVAHELDSDKVGGFGKLNNVLMRPLTDSGMTVVTIDHVTQNAETRNRMIGSVEKWNAIQGAAYKIERGRPFSMAESGWSSIQMVKDNQSATGWTNDQTIGYLVVEAGGLGPDRSKIWIQQAAPVNADRIGDLARLAAENGTREDAKQEQQQQRESAVLMEVMEMPDHWTARALADHMAGKYDMSGSTWQRVIKTLKDRGEITDADGKLVKVSSDVEYDATAETA